MSVQLLTSFILLWTPLTPLVLGAMQLFGLRLPERWVQRMATAHATVLMFAALGLCAVFIAQPQSLLEYSTPPLLVTHGYEWRGVLLVDRLSVTYLALVGLIYPIIVRFSRPFFHREEGSQRYWFLVTLLAFALAAVSLAGNIDVLYLGWSSWASRR